MGTHSFKIQDKELEEWMERKHEQGPYNNKSHVIRRALEIMKDNDTGEPLV